MWARFPHPSLAYWKRGRSHGQINKRGGSGFTHLCTRRRWSSSLLHRVHRFAHGPADDRYAYWRSLAAVWASTDILVNVEHDNEFSQSLVSALLACSHPLCTHAYRMHVPRSHWAHGWAPQDARRERGERVQWIERGEEWADYSAIGFCKIAPEARIGPLAHCEWPGVELAVNNATAGLWHVHWPGVAHHHTEAR